jgi:putative flippase GtrA
VGLVVFLAGEALLYILVQILHLEPHLAYLLQTVFSIETSFWLNRTVNWRDRCGSIRHQLVTFHMAKVGTVLVNQALFACLLAVHVEYLLAMMVCTAIISGVNYVANDRLVFRDHRVTPGSVPEGLVRELAPPPDGGSRVAVVIPVRALFRWWHALVSPTPE